MTHNKVGNVFDIERLVQNTLQSFCTNLMESMLKSKIYDFYEYVESHKFLCRIYGDSSFSSKTKKLEVRVLSTFETAFEGLGNLKFSKTFEIYHESFDFLNYANQYPNNLGELLALTKGVNFTESLVNYIDFKTSPESPENRIENFIFKSLYRNVTIYSDSFTALSWYSKGKILSKDFPQTHKRLQIRLGKSLIKAKIFQSKRKEVFKVTKWDTKNLGEIPADFGRK
jgi:hypothetical protein